MCAIRRAHRLRFILYLVGAIACIARFVILTLNLPPDTLPTPSPPRITFAICPPPPVPFERTSFEKHPLFTHYPPWNDTDLPAVADNYRYISLFGSLPSHLPTLFEQLRALWLLGLHLGRTVVLPNIQSRDNATTQAVLESIWDFNHIKQVTPVISPVDPPYGSSNCKASSRTLRLHYEDTVLTNGIPSYQTMDMFVMTAELAAMRRQPGRNATSLTIRTITDMNSEDACLLQFDLDRCPRSFYLFTEGVTSTLTGIENHFLHYRRELYDKALTGVAALMHYPYAAAWLEVPRKESDIAWRRAAEYDSPGHPIYLATTDPEHADFKALVESLRNNKGQYVQTFTELSAVYEPPEDPLVVAAAEQVLLAAASPFHFSPTDLYADQILTLRERLGMPAARDERAAWVVHTHVSAEEQSRAPPLPVCELGPED